MMRKLLVLGIVLLLASLIASLIGCPSTSPTVTTEPAPAAIVVDGQD